MKREPSRHCHSRVFAFVLFSIGAEFPMILHAQDDTAPSSAKAELIPMFGEIYPAIAVSMATVDFAESIPESEAAAYVSLLTEKSIDGIVGSMNPNLAVLLEGVEEDHPFTLEVKGGKYLQGAKTEGTIPASGNVVVFPNLVWKFDALRANRNIEPENLTLTVTLDNKKLPAVTKTVRVRSSRDCPFLILTEALPGTGAEAPVVSSQMAFAAFVNENHPLVDTILSEALALGVVDSFLGASQADAAQQIDELYAVWLALRKRGVQYGNLTQPSGESRMVVAQNIRTIEESLARKQANCVDGSVLLASIYRKLGYDVALVIVPGHCYLSVIAAETALRLETTLIGRKQEGKTDPICALPNPIDPMDQAARFFGSTKPDFGPDRYDRGLFHAALMQGARQTAEAFAAQPDGDESVATLTPEVLSGGEPPIRFVVIGEARAAGVTPLD